MGGGNRSRTFTLLVDGSHFREGLKRFRAMHGPRPSDKVHFAFDGSYLSVDALDSAFAARATGAWPGVASCGLSLVAALAKVPPHGEDISLRYEDGHLRIETLTVAAEWQPVSGSLLAAPVVLDWVETLSLKYRMHRSRLLNLGRMSEVESAEKKLTAVIARATKVLAPLGVRERDVRMLVEQTLRDRWGGNDSESR